MAKKQSLCLGLYIREDAKHLANSLLTCKQYIDHWLVIDASGASKPMVEKVLGDMPGHYQTGVGLSCSESFNLLQVEGLTHCENVILLQNNELLFNLDRNELSQINDAGFVNIEYANYTNREPRIISKQSFDWLGGNIATADLSETLTEESAITATLAVKPQTISEQDLIRQNQQLLDHQNQKVSTATGFSLMLARAKNLIALNQIGEAYELFEQLAEQKTNPEAQWQGQYLKANVELSAFKEIEQAILSLNVCLELDPTRGEPLARLQEIYAEQNRNEAATSLKDKLKTLPVPKTALFFEHQSYTLKDNAIKNNKTSQRQTKQARTIIELSDDENKDSNIPLTLGMATYDDYDGVYFTIMSLVLYHSDVIDQVEILVVDNNPDSKHGEAVKGLCKRVPQARYFSAGEYKGTAVRELVFTLARGKFVACMDCHVFLHQGSVAHLLDYFEQNPQSSDLFHGPLFYDGLTSFSTHMKPEWNAGFYGVWGRDERGKNFDAEPFEIPIQGLGLFACRRDAWPGFNKRFRGFGGEEGYIHEKVRQRGNKVLCLPFLRWTHRFDRPAGTQYSNVWEDRIRNYLLGADELKIDPKPAIEHFSEMLTKDSVALVIGNLEREQNSIFYRFNSVFHLSKQAELKKDIIDNYGLSYICQQIKLDNSDIEQKYAEIIRLAKQQKLPEILILSDEGLENPKLSDHISQAVLSLKEDKLVVLESAKDNEGLPQMLIIKASIYKELHNSLMSEPLNQALLNLKPNSL